MSDQQTTQQPTTQVQHVEIPQEIRVFLEAVLDEADLLILNDEEEQLILENMYRQLNVFLMSKVLETLPEEKVDGFVSVSEEGTEIQKLQEFLQKEIPNTGEFFEKAYEEFRELYLDTIAAEQARMDAFEENATNNPNASMLEKLAFGKADLPNQ